MNFPNILTLTRIFLTVVFINLLYQNTLDSKIVALAVFTLASITDFLDGYYARKYNLITGFGKIMDPIADKFLVLSAFFIFAEMNLIAVWMFGLITAREVVVTGLRLIAVQKGSALAAESAGKLKTVLQIIAIYLIMIFAIVLQLGVDTQGYHILKFILFWVVYVIMITVVAVTVWSGCLFVKNNRRKIF